MIVWWFFFDTVAIGLTCFFRTLKFLSAIHYVSLKEYLTYTKLMDEIFVQYRYANQIIKKKNIILHPKWKVRCLTIKTKPIMNDRPFVFFPRGIVINYHCLVYCKANSNCSEMFLVDGSKYLITCTLKEIEQLLPASFFFRPSKSYLINMHELACVDFNKRLLKLKNGTLVSLAVSKKELLKNRLIQVCGVNSK